MRLAEFLCEHNFITKQKHVPHPKIVLPDQMEHLWQCETSILCPGQMEHFEGKVWNQRLLWTEQTLSKSNLN